MEGGRVRPSYGQGRSTKNAGQIVDSAVHFECFSRKPCRAGWEGMCVSILGSRSISSILATGHSKQMGRQFMPMLLSLPGLRIGMIIAFCHISGICPVETNRLKMLMR